MYEIETITDDHGKDSVFQTNTADIIQQLTDKIQQLTDQREKQNSTIAELIFEHLEELLQKDHATDQLIKEKDHAIDHLQQQLACKNEEIIMLKQNNEDLILKTTKLIIKTYIYMLT